MEWLILSSRYWWKLPIEPFVISLEKEYKKINEEELANQLDKNQEFLQNWKYPGYEHILNLIKKEEEQNKKRKKIDEN